MENKKSEITKEEKETIAQPITHPVAAEKKAIDLSKPEGIKQYIFGSGKRVFLSQISSMDEAKAGELFNREASYAVQHMSNLPDNARPYFMSCVQKNPQSLLFAIANIASSGLTLNPDLKLCYLVPRQGKITYQSSWMGKKELIIQSGLCKNITVELVYEKDLFNYEMGTKPLLSHKADPFSDRGEIRGAYAVGFLSNGEKHVEVMALEEIKKIQKIAGTQYIWNTWFGEMAKKTIVNRLFKNLPKLSANPQLLALLKHESIELESDFDKIEISEKEDLFDE